MLTRLIQPILKPMQAILNLPQPIQSMVLKLMPVDLTLFSNDAVAQADPDFEGLLDAIAMGDTATVDTFMVKYGLSVDDPFGEIIARLMGYRRQVDGTFVHYSNVVTLPTADKPDNSDIQEIVSQDGFTFKPASDEIP